TSWLKAGIRWNCDAEKRRSPSRLIVMVYDCDDFANLLKPVTMASNPGVRFMAPSRQWLTNVVFLLLFCIAVQSQSSAPSTAPQQQASPSQSSNPQNQEKSATQEKPPKVYESATVLKTVTRLVVVDVVVTDNKGAPIADLTADNFTLLEDGKQQK